MRLSMTPKQMLVGDQLSDSLIPTSKLLRRRSARTLIFRREHLHKSSLGFVECWPISLLSSWSAPLYAGSQLFERGCVCVIHG